MHPDGKKVSAISHKTYLLIQGIIISLFDDNMPRTLYEIAEAVEYNMQKNNVDIGGSIEWFTVCIKQHLETVGLIETYVENSRKLSKIKLLPLS